MIDFSDNSCIIQSSRNLQLHKPKPREVVMDHLVGIQKFLATTPMWVTASIIILFAIVAMWILRRVSAGEWYNVTYSGQLGDVALTVVVLLGIDVLRSFDLPLPAWAGTEWGQLALLLVCYVIGLLLLEKHIMTMQLPEIVHGFIVVPVLLYLVVTALIVTIIAGMWGILSAEVGLIGFWAFLFYVDITTGRANQVAYHATHHNEYFLFGW